MRKYSDFQKSFGFCETWNPSLGLFGSTIWKLDQGSSTPEEKWDPVPTQLPALPHPHPVLPHASMRSPWNSVQKIWEIACHSNIKLLLLTWELVRNLHRKYVEKKTTINQNFLNLHLRVWLPVTTFTYKSQLSDQDVWVECFPILCCLLGTSCTKMSSIGKIILNTFDTWKADFLSFSLALGKVDSILYFKVLRMVT